MKNIKGILWEITKGYLLSITAAFEYNEEKEYEEFNNKVQEFIKYVEQQSPIA